MRTPAGVLRSAFFHDQHRIDRSNRAGVFTPSLDLEFDTAFADRPHRLGQALTDLSVGDQRDVEVDRGPPNPIPVGQFVFLVRRRDVDDQIDLAVA